jgi:hypothetical protein
LRAISTKWTTWKFQIKSNKIRTRTRKPRWWMRFQNR